MTHVLMLVANDVATDTRVKKEALAVARGGLQVTILGYTAETHRSMSMLGPVRIVRVPVPWRLRDERLRKRRERRARRPRVVGFASPEAEKAARLKLHLARRELEARRGRPVSLPGPLAPAVEASWEVQRLALRGRSLGLRGRSFAQRWLDEHVGLAWKAYDAAWNRTPTGASWRSVLPDVHDYEIAFGPVIDSLAPDVIHAHDVQMVGIAERASARARLAGRTVPWVYDAHEYVAGLSQYGQRTRRVVAAWEDLEREYIRSAARVITVSPPIADELQRAYDLPRRPSVVLNIPADPPVHDRAAEGATEKLSVRKAAGLADDVPLLVYGGGMTAARGVNTAVEALRHLPGVHLALVCVPHTRTSFVTKFRKQVEASDVADRVHFLEPAPPAGVVDYLSSATIGLHPSLHFGSHDMALPNKLFEYIHAGLPVVGSDLTTQTEFVNEHGIGEIHRAEDPVGLAEAVKKVLGDLDRYRAAVRDPKLREQYTWLHQEQILRGLYSDLLGRPLDDPAEDVGAAGLLELAEAPITGARPADAPPCLGIGPANMAGQAWEWAKAVERSFPQVRTEVFTVDRGAMAFSADIVVPQETFARSVAWQLEHMAHVCETYSHLLVEAGRPIFGTLNGRWFDSDLPLLREAGISIGLVFHGSEVRDPAKHREAYPWSPFTDPNDPLTKRLQSLVRALMPRVDAFDGPKFVSTPDLLDDVRGAEWLPVVVDLSRWKPGEQAPMQRERPVVVHAPSNKAVKGTQHIEPVLRRLDAEGLIEYRPIEGVPHAEMPARFADADIVVDHMGIGNYGVVTCEAMATGRVTVSHVHERVRERVPLELPVVEARPDTLEQVVRDLCADRDRAREIAARGPAFVAELHDGRRSAQVLQPFLGVTAPGA